MSNTTKTEQPAATATRPLALRRVISCGLMAVGGGTLVTMCLLGILFVSYAYSTLLPNLPDNPRPTGEPAGMPQYATPTTPIIVPIRSDRELATKPPDGVVPVELTVYSDFTCIWCARSAPILDRVREVYGGKVRVNFRHFPLRDGGASMSAAHAAECAREQGYFWAMHDRLFANRNNLGTTTYRRLASEIGLDGARFDQCVREGWYADRIARDRDEGQAMGVHGTPAFFAGDQAIYGAPDFAELCDLLDQALTEQRLRN